MKLMDLSVFDNITPGKWEADDEGVWTRVNDYPLAICIAYTGMDGPHSPEENFEAIAALPDLLAENRKLRKVVEAQGLLLAFHEQQMIEFEKDYDHTVVGNEHRLGTYNRLRQAITDAKEALE